MQSTMELRSYNDASQAIQMLGSSNAGPKSNTGDEVDAMHGDHLLIS